MKVSGTSKGRQQPQRVSIETVSTGGKGADVRLNYWSGLEINPNNSFWLRWRPFTVIWCEEKVLNSDQIRWRCIGPFGRFAVLFVFLTWFKSTRARKEGATCTPGVSEAERKNPRRCWIVMERLVMLLRGRRVKWKMCLWVSERCSEGSMGRADLVNYSEKWLWTP